MTERLVVSALQGAGMQLAFLLLDLAEGIPCQPTLWAHDGRELKQSILEVQDADDADRVVAELRQTAIGALAWFSVASPVDLIGEESGESEGIQVLLCAPGTPFELVLALPYDRPDFAFPRGGLRLLRHQGFPADFPLERVRTELFAPIEHGTTRERPGSAIAKLPRTLVPDHRWTVRNRPPPPRSELAPTYAEAVERFDALGGRPKVLALAGLAIYAGFLAIADADGERGEGEVQAFVEALADLRDPFLRSLVMPGGLLPHHCIELVSERHELVSASITAAGVVFARHPEGPGALQAYLELLQRVARRNGEIGPQEQLVLDEITEALQSAGVGRS